MTLHAFEALTFITRALSLALIIQSLESLQLRHTLSENGIWRWSILRDEFKIFPKPLFWIFDSIFKTPVFNIILVIRLVVAIAAMFFPLNIGLTVGLFITTILISLRWRGSFNGGSDSMTIVILTALTISSIWKESTKVSIGCLFYIALQVCTSYFIAGVSKIKHSKWRKGIALQTFIASSVFSPSLTTTKALSHSHLITVLSWAIMIFEIAFPLALFNSILCSLFIAFAITFHLANVFIFGLNRFFWTWLATYPALYFCSLLSGL